MTDVYIRRSTLRRHLFVEHFRAFTPSNTMTKEALAQSLGARIRARRKSLGLTQTDVAGDHLTKSLISQIEKGQTLPSLWSLILITRRLDCTVGYLIGETDDAPGPDLDMIARRVGLDPDTAVRFLEALLRDHSKQPDREIR